MKKKREKVKGRAAAILFMILAILASVPVGTCVSLNREREKAQEAYVGSEEVFGLLGDLSACGGEAMNFLELGGKYLPGGDARLVRLEDTSFEVDAAASPRGKAMAFRALSDAMEDLYNALGELELDADDEQYRIDIYADFKAAADMMQRRAEDYNEDAAEFNALFEKAPGRALAERFGVRELELFE